MNRIATKPLSVCLYLLALAAWLPATPLAASADPPGKDWLAEAQAKADEVLGEYR